MVRIYTHKRKLNSRKVYTVKTRSVHAAYAMCAEVFLPLFPVLSTDVANYQAFAVSWWTSFLTQYIKNHMRGCRLPATKPSKAIILFSSARPPICYWSSSPATFFPSLKLALLPGAPFSCAPLNLLPIYVFIVVGDAHCFRVL